MEAIHQAPSSITKTATGFTCTHQTPRAALGGGQLVSPCYTENTEAQNSKWSEWGMKLGRLASRICMDFIQHADLGEKS